MTAMQKLINRLEPEVVEAHKHQMQGSVPEHVVMESIAVSLADISHTLRKIEKKIR